MKNPGQQHTVNVGGIPIVLEKTEGQNPGIVWLGGYQSDMYATKASFLAKWASENAQAFLRHDYSGHGLSGGEFLQGTISRWLKESLFVFNSFTNGRQILVGSSMGAWIALRMVQILKQEQKENLLAGLVLIAPAPDFTREIVEPTLNEKQQNALSKKGFVEISSSSSPSVSVYSQALLQDGEQNLVMQAPLNTSCPVHILHGLRDSDVPCNHALRLACLLPAEDVTLSFIPDGDHRLSRPNDLSMILQAITEIIARDS